LNVGVEYAKVAEACGLKGVKVRDMKELTDALRTAIQDQMNNNTTTFIEVVLNQELGEPFRRDAMKAPVAVAGIDAADMKPQQIS
jgi:sulfoacetaldehyde acetyltransferase